MNLQLHGQPILAVGAPNVEMITFRQVVSKAVRGGRPGDKIINDPFRCVAIAQLVVPNYAVKALELMQNHGERVLVRGAGIELHARLAIVDLRPLRRLAHLQRRHLQHRRLLDNRARIGDERRARWSSVPASRCSR